MLIKNFESSYYVADVFNPLFSLISLLHESTIQAIDYSIEMNTSRNIIKVNKSDDFYICALHLNDTITRLYSYDNMISYPRDGYTLLYIISNNMLFQSDFILIDNTSNKYLCSGDRYNYIKQESDY
jgi:hypothetical protein